MKKLLTILSLGIATIAAVFCTGCATTTTTDGTTKTASEILTDAVAIGTPALKTSCKTATILVLKNNPDLVDEIGSISTVVAAVVNSGSASSTEITAALEAAIPDLDADVATMIGDSVATMWDTVSAYYKAKTGTELTLSALGDTNVTAIVQAIATGVSEGVTAYKASASS